MPGISNLGKYDVANFASFIVYHNMWPIVCKCAGQVAWYDKYRSCLDEDENKGKNHHDISSITASIRQCSVQNKALITTYNEP